MTTFFAAALAALLAQASSMAMPSVAPSTPPPGKPAKAAVVVHIHDFKFVPATVKIVAGQTVEWVNDDNDAHTVTSSTKAFDSGGLDTNDRWSHAFKSAGTYAYLCALHPYMKGAVVVTAPPASH